MAKCAALSALANVLQKQERNLSGCLSAVCLFVCPAVTMFVRTVVCPYSYFAIFSPSSSSFPAIRMSFVFGQHSCSHITVTMQGR